MAKLHRRKGIMKTLGLASLGLVLAASCWAQSSGKGTLLAEIDSVYPQVQTLYVDLHQHPELSGHEVNTAAKVAAELRKLGYEVAEKVGGTGVVAVLRNGPGPTVMLRTELDALPVEEKTGLPYASKVTTKNDAGVTVPVMHACGHDIHMAALVGTAEIMTKTKDQWHGTLMLIGQPAEETVGGAQGMLADGLFTRFPKPDFAIALHTTNNLPAGKVGVTAGYSRSNADTVNITIYGRGGHGARPETTVDPIVIAAKTILSLQTIISREIKPGDPAVITVGYIQGGTKNNIIPDEVHLGLTVRSFTTEVRKKLLAAIERVAKAEAESANAPKPPLVQVIDPANAVYNDPRLAERLSVALSQALGAGNVEQIPAEMVSEDFSAYVEAGVPSLYFSLGVADPAKFKEAEASGVPLPSNHSPFYAPDVEPSLKTAIEAEIAVLRNLMATGSSMH
jgi:amidohydrolase